MADEGFVPISTKVNSSKIRKAFSTNIRSPNNTNCGNKPISINSAKSFFKNKASFPNDVAGNEIKLSEFREASVITGNIYTYQETDSTYGDNNNGCLVASLNCNTIVTGSDNRKNYGFKINTGGWTEKSELVSSPNANARKITLTGIDAPATYTVCMRDGLNPSYTYIKKTAYVTCAGGNKKYTNIQRSNDEL